MVNFNFFDSFYFMMTTVSVVGYGSSVSSLGGKMALIVIILAFIVTIPEKAADLVALLNSKSKYALGQYDHVHTVPHIVLMGNLSMNSL
jgi:ABC-type phosphate transport system permease subunit